MSEHDTPMDGLTVPPAPETQDAPAPEASAPAKKPRSGRRPAKASSPSGGRNAGRLAAAPVLGVHVTSQSLYGVLLRPTADGFEPIRQFSRQRASSAAASAPELASLAELGIASTPDMLGPQTDDGVTIKFGDSGAGGGSELFLESELREIGASGDGMGDDVAFDAAQASKKLSTPIVFELKDLVEECRAAGFDRPALSFALAAPDVDYVEITVPAEPEKKASGKGAKGKKEAAPARKSAAKAAEGPVKRERLLSLVPKGDVAYERERIAFMPMTPRDGLRRYLAILPRPEEPVAESIDLLRQQQGMRRVPFRALDAEVPLLVGMARLAFPTEPHENTALVRVGTEDTLVVLLQGNQLHHCDHMRSVTTFDGPDTICSRVLLQQDVQGVGTVHNVIVISEEREDDLVAGFSAFYPDARVETLRAGIARVGIAGPYGPLPPQAMAATGTALKALLKKDGIFDDLNLLPKKLRGKASVRPTFAFAWHTAVVGVLLFLSVLFFVGLYFTQNRKIADAERRLAEYPPQATMSSAELQARIDSLQAVHTRITTSLQILDSLLIGSDQWTQTLARTTRAAAATGGVWVEEWTPSDSGLVLHGYATARGHVVQLAQRLNGSISEVTFKAIREFPVYEYRIQIQVPQELPQVARYLRERALEQAAPPTAPEPLENDVPLPAGAAARPAAPTPQAPRPAAGAAR